MDKAQLISDLDELLALDVEEQKEWLEVTFLENANKAGEEVSLYLIAKAWDEPIGAYFEFDQSRFDDMVKYPEAYDLGWDLQSRIPEMTDDRAEAINEGAKLDEAELEETRGLVNDGQEESDEGINCSGFTFNFNEDTTCFAAFTGPSIGQGGIEYDFYRLFRDKKAAIDHLSKLGDRWWSF